MALKQRARKEEDKAARREAILDVAASLLGRRQFASVTMAEVARSCGLAKGTLYLYFKSKEELALASLERELAAWFDDVAARLVAQGPTDPDRFGEVVAQSLAQRDQLTDLLTILHTVLEHNIDPDVALSFKRMLVEKITLGGRALESVLPGFANGDGARLLLRMHALVVGLRQMSDPAPSVAAVLELPELALLRVDFEPALATAVADIVRGMQQSANMARSG